MNYAFFGTPRFAAIVLDRLIARGLRPSLIVANPDRPAGRKRTLQFPPTKIIAQANHIELLQPNSPREIREQLLTGHYDLFLVAAYARIIPNDILSIPRLGTIGIHPSMLPKYRGSTPIQNAILAGDATTGVSLYQLDEKMDHGPIFGVREVSISDTDHYQDLEQKLALSGSDLFASLAPDILSGRLHPHPQDHSSATVTTKTATSDAFIAPADLSAACSGNTDLARVILRKINAYDPEPGAWTMNGDRRLKLLSATIENGALKLTRIQYAGEIAREV